MEAYTNSKSQRTIGVIFFLPIMILAAATDHLDYAIIFAIFVLASMFWPLKPGGPWP